MIAGLITIIVLLVIRLPSVTAVRPNLPEHVVLPDGLTAEAVTFGRGWIAVGYTTVIGTATPTATPSTSARAVAGSAARLCRPASPVVTPAQREAVRAATRDEAVDVLLLDLGAQADPLTLDAFLEADVSVVITVPQPAAIERMYCFLRAALHRRLFGGDDEAAVVARALLTADRVGQLDSPARLIDALGSVHPDAAEALRARVLGFAPKVLVNRCRNRGDSELGADLVFALRRRLGVSAEWIGSIEGDEAAAESARRRRPLALTWPGASLSAAIDRLARRLLGQLEGREVRL